MANKSFSIVSNNLIREIEDIIYSSCTVLPKGYSEDEFITERVPRLKPSKKQVTEYKRKGSGSYVSFK